MPTFEKTGSIPFDPKIDPAELLSDFGKCFEGIRANDLWVSGNQLTFSGDAFRFVNTLNPLLLLRIRRCDRRSPPPRRRLPPSTISNPMYFTAVAILLEAAILTITNLPDLAWLILVLPFLCVALVLIGVRIGLLRFESFLRRSLASAPNPVVTV